MSIPFLAIPNQPCPRAGCDLWSTYLLPEFDGGVLAAVVFSHDDPETGAAHAWRVPSADLDCWGGELGAEVLGDAASE